MKTPEQLAEEYAFKFYLNEDSGYAMTMNRDAFLAGYQAAINSPEKPDSSDDSDAPDLQEQLEALQAYMTVAQRKIMALQSNVDLLLYLNKERIGESEAIRRTRQTMQGFGRNDE